MSIKLIEQHSAALRCTFFSFEKLKENLVQLQGNMLGAACFGVHTNQSIISLPCAPLAYVSMPLLDVSGNAGSTCEVWRSEATVIYGHRSVIRFGYNDEILFGVMQLPEADFDKGATHDSAKTPLQQASEFAYRTLFELIDELKFPQVLRIWNYIADINGNSHGMERYRQFNMGRHEGFVNGGRQVTGSVPAASAVGFREGPLTIYFLAGRGAAPIAIENPRQVSAYRYPETYGPRSPTFSRASVAHLGGENVLFLSGTASIVGHETLHVGDVVAQTHEALANIAAIVMEANRVAPKADFKLDGLSYKVYVRHAKDVSVIHDELRRTLGASASLIFLLADICRSNLLVEIEGTAGHHLDFSL